MPKTIRPLTGAIPSSPMSASCSAGHTDVGGGHPEHALSDVPLLWFIDRLQHPDVGLPFQRNPRTLVAPTPALVPTALMAAALGRWRSR